jgi:hypothetical protein
MSYPPCFFSWDGPEDQQPGNGLLARRFAIFQPVVRPTVRIRYKISQKILLPGGTIPDRVGSMATE